MNEVKVHAISMIVKVTEVDYNFLHAMPSNKYLKENPKPKNYSVYNMKIQDPMC